MFFEKNEILLNFFVLDYLSNTNCFLYVIVLYKKYFSVLVILT